jgi:hypothetical protein
MNKTNNKNRSIKHGLDWKKIDSIMCQIIRSVDSSFHQFLY